MKIPTIEHEREVHVSELDQHVRKIIENYRLMGTICKLVYDLYKVPMPLHVDVVTSVMNSGNIASNILYRFNTILDLALKPRTNIAITLEEVKERSRLITLIDLAKLIDELVSRGRLDLLNYVSYDGYRVLNRFELKFPSLASELIFPEVVSEVERTVWKYLSDEPMITLRERFILMQLLKNLAKLGVLLDNLKKLQLWMKKLLINEEFRHIFHNIDEIIKEATYIGRIELEEHVKPSLSELKLLLREEEEMINTILDMYQHTLSDLYKTRHILERLYQHAITLLLDKYDLASRGVVHVKELDRGEKWLNMEWEREIEFNKLILYLSDQAVRIDLLTRNDTLRESRYFPFENTSMRIMLELLHNMRHLLDLKQMNIAETYHDKIINAFKS